MKNITSKIAYALVVLAIVFTVGQIAYARIYNPPAGGGSVDTTQSYTFTAKQNFNANASTTGVSAGYGYFGETATTSFSRTGVMTMGTTTAGVLNVSASGVVYSGTASAGNLTGVITSTGLATVLGANGSVNSSQMMNWNSDETGTGAAVYATGPFITSPIIVTDMRAPIINGGAAAGSTLILRSTSAAGTTDAIIFQTGSQVEKMRLLTGGQFGIGTTTPVALFQVTAALNATTTMEVGRAGSNKGSCEKKYRYDGSAIYVSYDNTNAEVISTTPCATVTGF